MWRPKESISKPTDNAQFLGARDGVGWQGAVRDPDQGVGVNIVLGSAWPDSKLACVSPCSLSTPSFPQAPAAEKRSQGVSSLARALTWHKDVEPFSFSRLRPMGACVSAKVFPRV